MFDFLTTKRGFRIAWVVALLASILAVVIDDIFPLNSNLDLKEKLTFAQDESFELLTGTKAIFFFAFFMLYALCFCLD